MMQSSARLRRLAVGIAIALACALPASPLPLGADWPTYGGSYANTRHSDLTQITPKNVSSLRLAWSFSTGVYGQFETSPVVVGDTLYFTTGLTNMVIALDAATGSLRWRFQPKVGDAPYIMQVNRGVAVDGGKVFYATLDDQLIALDARSGKPVWNVRIADPRSGASETMAPLAWNGLVFIGSSGGEYGIRGSLSAYDQRDGRLVWQWWTVSAGWEGRYTESVNGISLHRDVARERADAPRYREAWRHGGGPIWMTPALSAEDGTLYLSTGNPAPNYNAETRPGDNLYTDSIVALDARTGRMKWYYQETPHDRWDLDAASPPVLFDAVDSSRRRVPAVGQAGKTGWFYILDRRTGHLIRLSQPFIPQSQLYQPPSRNGQIVQPGEGGGAIGPVAYDPARHAIFVAGVVAYERAFREALTPWPKGAAEWQGGNMEWLGHAYSLFSRIDVDTGRIAWQYRASAPIVGGALSAGDLVFTGEEGTGFLNAFDAATGALLWRVSPAKAQVEFGSPLAWVGRTWSIAERIGKRVLGRLTHRAEPPDSDDDIHAPPVAYMVNGREYVVIAADRMYSTLDVNGGDTLYAFTLR
jgi:PQQ-dependent dehydrogenase (methanol/ethanol family)